MAAAVAFLRFLAALLLGWGSSICLGLGGACPNNSPPSQEETPSSQGLAPLKTKSQKKSRRTTPGDKIVTLYRGGDIFRNDVGDIVAKSGDKPSKTYSVWEHVTNNPKDSNWISFTVNPGVAFWFAVNGQPLGTVVTLSQYGVPKRLVTCSLNHFGNNYWDAKGRGYASWAEEWCANTTVSGSTLQQSVSFVVTKRDLRWCRDHVSDWGIPFPEHRVGLFE